MSACAECADLRAKLADAQQKQGVARDACATLRAQREAANYGRDALAAKLAAAEAERAGAHEEVRNLRLARDALSLHLKTAWSERDDARERAAHFETALAASEVRRKRLVEALRFYAEQSKWLEGGYESNGPVGWVTEPSDAEKDSGAVAREALAAEAQEGEPKP